MSIDVIGKRYGKLVALKVVGKNERGSLVECLCDCGNKFVVAAKELKSGNNKSCGCLVFKHGMTRTRIYNSWQNMKKRCNNPNYKDYANYGGRGIKHCVKWETFEGFYEDMKDGYDDFLTLDRIDVDGDYCKENCRWITSLEQNNNKRSNHIHIYKGEKLTLRQISEKYDIDYELLHNRIRAGWSIKRAIETPKEEQEQLTFNGVTKTTSNWAKEKGMTYHQLKKRLMRGWTIERALTQPLRKSPKTKAEVD